MQLYVYDHCPYCVRARMIFGLKNLSFENKVIDNDDEATPVGLVGKKVVPILVKEDGTAMPESLDIVKYIDETYGEKLLSDEVRPEIIDWIKKVGGYYNHLLLPRFVRIGLAEFNTQSAVDYFVKKKTANIGDFDENFADSAQYLAQLAPDLAELDKFILDSGAANGKLSLEDILLFPMLRNLSCVKNINFPPKVAGYVTKMAELSKIDLYTDRAL